MIVMVILFNDIKNNGCLLWHRNSFGILFSKWIVAILFLFFFIGLRSYSISKFYGQEERSYFLSILPLYALIVLAALKVRYGSKGDIVDMFKRNF